MDKSLHATIIMDCNQPPISLLKETLIEVMPRYSNYTTLFKSLVLIIHAVIAVLVLLMFVDEREPNHSSYLR